MRNTLHTLLLILLTFGLTGCSLFTLEMKSDSEPLPKRELNIRVVTQQFALDAFSEIERVNDSVRNETKNLNYIANTLLWSINLQSGLQQSVLQQKPQIALIDTWAFLEQVRRYVDSPETVELFGEVREKPLQLTISLHEAIEKISRRLVSSSDYSQIREFVYDFADRHPFEDLKFKRVSVYEDWIKHNNIADSMSVVTVGTIPEVMSDFANRMMMLSNTLGKGSKWQLEYFAASNGITAESTQAMADSISYRIELFQKFLDNSPELIDFTITRFEEEVTPMIELFDRRVAITMAQLSEERIALDSLVARERREIMIQVDSISENLLRVVMQEAKGLIATYLVYVTIFFAVIIFLPFAIGFFTGRVFTRIKRGKKSDEID
ncbi:MAG: hypothetical protein ACRCZM_00550 [Bacteroidales bacterium]